MEPVKVKCSGMFVECVYILTETSAFMKPIYNSLHLRNVVLKLRFIHMYSRRHNKRNENFILRHLLYMCI